jgi:thiamine pyrophosphokinase
MKRFPLINEVTDFDAIILADGEFPVAVEPLTLLRKASFVCACDGAAVHYPTADVIIGDGDSVPEIFRNRLVQVDEQEDNDLTKATRYCVSKGLRRIVYLGTTGLREDHTLGNISLMVRYALEMGVRPLLATNYGWFVVAEGNSAFDSFPRQQVSIFNVDCQSLASEMLRWNAYPYRQFWQGTLNEAVGRKFVLRGDGHYIVYRTYNPKA